MLLLQGSRFSEIYIPNPLQCYAYFKYGHHQKKCRLYGDELCRRCRITCVTHDESRCTNDFKCVNCGEDHPSTIHSCKIWKREKEVASVYREGLSFPEARKDVQAPYNLSSTVVKVNRASTVELKDAQTQITEATTQNTQAPQTKVTTNAKPAQKPPASRKPKIPAPKSPNISQNKVLSERLPKGSDDLILQHNRFQPLDEEDMEAENNPAETNKQGKIIKIYNNI